MYGHPEPDEFPTIPTAALVDQLMKIARTLAHRSNHSNIPTIDPQQLMAMQLQQYQQHQQQQPPSPLFTSEPPKAAAWHQPAPAVVRLPPHSGTVSRTEPPARKFEPLADANGDLYCSVCNKGDHPCRYYLSARLDKPGSKAPPSIDPKALHISDLRNGEDASDSEQELRDHLKERNIPYKDIRFNDRGYAEIFFDTHGDATAAQLYLVEQSYNVNFKRLQDRQDRTRNVRQ